MISNEKLRVIIYVKHVPIHAYASSPCWVLPVGGRKEDVYGGWTSSLY